MTLDSIANVLSPLSSDATLMDCLGTSLIDRNGANIQYSSQAEKEYNLHKSMNLYHSLPLDYEECISKAILMLQSHGFDLQKYNLIFGDISVEQSKEAYVEANKTKNRTWMKCPTIVESWRLVDSINAVGGHNLNSKVTKFRVGKDLKAGQTRIGEDGIIEISTKDRMTRVSNQDYLRKVGRLGDNSMGKVVDVRSKQSVIGLTQQRTARGFNSSDHLTVEVDFNRGHTMNGKHYDNLTELLHDLGANLVEGKAQYKQIEISGLKGAGVEVDVFLDGALSRIRKGSSANIPLEKYDFSHPTVKYEGDKAFVTIPIKPGTIEFVSTSKVNEAGLGGSSNIKPKVRISGGEVVFKVPKSKLQAFLDMIREFLAKQKGAWNELKIKIEMKRRGIDPADCEEKTQLRVAKNFIINQGVCHVWDIQEETA